jgi:hypothetical protein
MTNIPRFHAPPNRISTILQDLAAARGYLREVAVGCLEGARADDPRVTSLALALLAHAGAELRVGEKNAHSDAIGR